MMNEELPPELVLAILLRLPRESLLPLRLVCKQWYNLIYTLIDEPFIKEHLGRDLILINYWTYQSTCTRLIGLDLNISEPQAQPQSLLLGKASKKYHCENSCNGLLCISTCQKNGEEKAVVCNPLRQELPFVLPPPTVKSCRPALSVYGLGFDSSIRKYKVIRLYVRDVDRANRCYCMGSEMYTLQGAASSSASWREIGHPPFLLPLRQSVNASGALHWRAHLDFYPRKCSIISFDFKQEKFNTILPPEEAEDQWPGGFELVDLRGYLGVSHVSGDRHIDIWKLKDYEKKEWVREFRIPTLQPVVLHGELQVIGLMGEDEVLWKHHRGLFAYNSKTSIVRFVYITRPGLRDVEEEVRIHTPGLASLGFLQ